MSVVITGKRALRTAMMFGIGAFVIEARWVLRYYRGTGR